MSDTGTVRLPLQILQGATFERAFRLFQDVLKINRTDLTGYSIRAMIRRRESDPSPIWSGSTDTTGITITDAANGEFSMEIDATTTASLPSRHELMWQLELVSGAGKVYRLFEGPVAVVAEVTK